MSTRDSETSRQFALEVVQRLRHAGYQAVWAGGCVRDWLLGLTPKDYDVATSALPDEVQQVFGKRRTLAIGASFGVIAVRGPRAAGMVEVATFRSDRGYSDGRRPDKVEFTTAELDAQRRDFTINGIFYDPLEDQVIDYVGGQRDLTAGIVRAIGDADQRIGEDKLRMLRGVRFAAWFGFTLESETHDAIRRWAPELMVVSGERIGAEMRGMLEHTSRARAIGLLRDTTLLSQVLPELDGISTEEWDETLRVTSRLKQVGLAVVLAALLRGQNGRVEAAIADRWRLTNREAERADWLIAHLPDLLSATSLPWPRLQRILIHPGAHELLELGRAIAGGNDPAVALCQQKLSLSPEELNPPPLVTGDDLLKQGLAPGPQMGGLLESIRDAQLEGAIATRDEALALALRLARG